MDIESHFCGGYNINNSFGDSSPKKLQLFFLKFLSKKKYLSCPDPGRRIIRGVDHLKMLLNLITRRNVND